MTTKDEVSQFLRQLKSVRSVGQLFFADRSVNKQTILDLEITAKQREICINELVLEDYSEGPLDNDQYGSSPMWVFGKTIKNKEIYIKITVSELNVICISFHTSQYSMNYPFK
ncbi:hypothetical protein [Kaistella yonginensis]|uniref:hypothetical protein n=1 Tax=Kaistella yonginensis TaxID=658267 RepID=UPI0025B5CEE4|nr:hypothetical protein [Kaistella yonginensis]MDN3607693.1 hypothetical protein [Kaistella yonginensis]